MVDELVGFSYAKVQSIAQAHNNFEPSLWQRHEAFLRVEIRWLGGDWHDGGWETFRRGRNWVQLALAVERRALLVPSGVGHGEILSKICLAGLLG